MKTSIATVSISGDLREKLEAIAAAGFDGVEIFENDFLAYDRSPRDVAAMVRGEPERNWSLKISSEIGPS